jgi:hypothetical protein
MLVFNQILYDGFISGTADVFTEPSQLLGSVERVTWGLIVNAVAGTSPTITLQFQNSPDGSRWTNQSSIQPEGNALSLSAGDNILAPGTNFPPSSGTPIANYIRIRLALGGTSPSGYVRLWVVGRTATR